MLYTGTNLVEPFLTSASQFLGVNVAPNVRSNSVFTERTISQPRQIAPGCIVNIGTADVQAPANWLILKLVSNLECNDRFFRFTFQCLFRRLFKLDVSIVTSFNNENSKT